MLLRGFFMLMSNHFKVFQCLRNGSFLFQRASWLTGILGFRFIVVLALNRVIVMQGEWGSCLFSCNSYPPFGANLSSPLLCRCDPAGSKSKERCVKSLLCFLCFHWKCAVGFLHICMCCGRDWFTQIVVEKSFLFSKIYLDGWP